MSRLHNQKQRLQLFHVKCVAQFGWRSGFGKTCGYVYVNKKFASNVDIPWCKTLPQKSLPTNPPEGCTSYLANTSRNCNVSTFKSYSQQIWPIASREQACHQRPAWNQGVKRSQLEDGNRIHCRCGVKAEERVNGATQNLPWSTSANMQHHVMGRDTSWGESNGLVMKTRCQSGRSGSFWKDQGNGKKTNCLFHAFFDNAKVKLLWTMRQ